MREIRPSGSVRGAGREARPYRDYPNSDAKQRGLLLVVPRHCTEAADASKPPRRAACGWTTTAARLLAFPTLPRECSCYFLLGRSVLTVSR